MEKERSVEKNKDVGQKYGGNGKERKERGGNGKKMEGRQFEERKGKLIEQKEMGNCMRREEEKYKKLN